ncbi:MAG TPA: FAD-binding oxidoreductase [Thermoanaerobaculia bacterium]|nr:FAD-binding oxidoreductase [Thermoanaerobaculia bacterium]
MSDVADAIVVGAGIVGAACAEALAADGRRVVVLDAAFAGGGTTAAGMGHLVAMDDSEPQLALTAWSNALWKERADELPAACEMDPCGTLWVAEDGPQMESVEAKRERYAAHGIASEALGASELARLEPNLRPGLAGALRVPGDSVLYPPAAARALLDRAASHNAVLRERVAVRAIDAGTVDTSEGTWRAPVVVNAAGARAAELTPGLPILPRKGHLVITDRYPGFCRHQVVELGYLKSAHTMTTESVAFNVQPRATGQLLVGSSRELVGWRPEINPRIVSRMLARAFDFLPALRALSAIRTWTGFRPATPDKLPLVGRWRPVEGLWIAAGHEGLGITTSLGTGRLLADLVAGRRPAIDPAPFDPNRAAEGTDA